METSFLLAVGASLLVAGFVKGVVGLGLPTVVMGTLSLVMPPVQAATLLTVPSMVTHFWQLAGGALLPKDSGIWAVVALGVALMLYALAGLFSLQLRVPARREAWLGPMTGAATGPVTGATGVFVIPGVPYLQALGLARDALLPALAGMLAGQWLRGRIAQQVFKRCFFAGLFALGLHAALKPWLA